MSKGNYDKRESDIFFSKKTQAFHAPKPRATSGHRLLYNSSQHGTVTDQISLALLGSVTVP